MPFEAMSLSSDSQNPEAPLFAVYDSHSDTWYMLDAELWIDVTLQGDDPDEFAFFCEGCLKLLGECRCEIGH